MLYTVVTTAVTGFICLDKWLDTSCDRHTDIQKDGWTEVTVFVTVLKLEIPYPLKM